MSGKTERGERDDAHPSTGAAGEGIASRSPRSVAEWTTLLASIVVIAVLVGAALFEHVASDEPAGVRVSIEIDLEQVDVRDGLSYVPFTVINTGRDPAEHVVVLFEIKQGAETVEESTTDVAFLPNGGRVDGELVTALDLSAHTIEARVTTIQIP